MNRRKVLAVLLTLVLLVTFAACGKTDEPQGEGKTPVIKIGVMQFGEFTALQNAYSGFVDGLAAAGYVNGQNVKLNYLSAAGDPANCPTIADSLINDGSDLIFAIATPSVSCIKEKTTDIPVLFTAVTDPVASGFFADAKKPGGNISGTSDMNPVKEQIDLLKELLPMANAVAVLYCSSESNSAVQYEMAKAEIEALDMVCVQKTISVIDEVQSVIESLRGQVDAIYIPTDNTLSEAMTSVAQFANDAQIPVIGAEPGMVENGATATYGIDYYNLGKQTAAMAVKVLQAENRLACVAAMPVEYQTEACITAVNQNSVDAIGLDVPESIGARAVVY